MNGSPESDKGSDKSNTMFLEAAVAAGFDTTNPVIAGVLDNISSSYTGGVNKPPPKKANPYMCEICKCEMSSALVYETHINGAKHKKKVQSVELAKVLNVSITEVTDDDSSQTFSCQLCNLTTNSPLQLKTHLEGAKHKRKENHITNIELDEPKNKIFKSEDGVIKCELCQVEVKTKSQLVQHEETRKHKLKVRSSQHQPNGKRFGGGPRVGSRGSSNRMISRRTSGNSVATFRGVQRCPPPGPLMGPPPLMSGARPAFRGGCPAPMPVPPPRPFRPNGNWMAGPRWSPPGAFYGL